MRLIRNARLQNSKLSENELYTFSLNHTLSVYSIDAVYTFIPKNACSTMRYSLALQNGYVRDIEDINWIHQNTQTFVATQREIARAKYTFTMLRCPFTRVASCFLDKIVNQLGVKFHDSMGNQLSINFNEFLSYIYSQKREQRDQHWRNQADFLHYEQYDDYFNLEEFSEAEVSLNNNGFKIHNTQNTLKHGISSLEKIEGNFSKVKEVELKKMREDGFAPDYKSMFGDDEIKLVKEIYKDDIDLYTNHFGNNNLLF